MTTFGRSVLDLWHLDPSLAYLNHGTVGATPRYVLDRQREWVERIERHPAQFLLRELSNPTAAEWTETEAPWMRLAAAAVADFVGAPDSDGLALIDNITTGANAVLRSLDLGPDDIIAVTTVGYGAVNKTAEFVATQSGATLDVIELPGPGATSAEFAEAFDRQLRPETTLAVVDHLSAFSALVLPVDKFIASCKTNDVMVLVDAAHVPGQLPLDLVALHPERHPEFCPDFYTANLHKWVWTPRSSGFLWVAPQHREWLHPTVISWGIGNGLAAEFDLQGTRDPSPFLVIPEVLDYRASFGEDKIKHYIHELCWASANHLADYWGTSFTTPEEMIGAMAVVPLPDRLGHSSDHAEAVRRYIHDEHKVEAPVFALDEVSGLVVRICTQIYNDHSDIERLAQAIDQAPNA